MDFFVRERTAVEQIQVQEDREFYPPRFQVFLAGTDPTLSDGSIRFKGADCDLQYDIYLELPDQDTGRSSTAQDIAPSATALGIIQQSTKHKNTFIVTCVTT